MPVNGGSILTTDGRSCIGNIIQNFIGMCTTNIVPGKPGADAPPEGA